MPLEPGSRVGPYELISVLGSGGMGTVYLAHDTRLHRRVALKFVSKDASSPRGEDPSRRILHEARAASALNHPNICQIYDVGGEGAEAWIAMEHIEGQPLNRVVASGGRLPAGEVIRLGVEIADGLGHAHSRGILHRDLKSANIVRDHAGRPKILDFGIAARLPTQVAQEITRTGTGIDSPGLTGTLAYMAPEVIRGEQVTERSDLWSLGVVLYELITGDLPFRGRNAFDLASAILQGAAAPVPTHMPQPLMRVVARLLATNPDERYANAHAVATALREIDSTRTVPARRARRTGVVMAASGLAALAVFALWRFEHERPLQLGEQRLIRADQAVVRAPSYSADESMLAYLAPDSHGIQQIWVRKLEQGVSMQVTHGDVNASRPRWIGKNDRIVYAQAGRGIWSVSPLGGTPTRLVEQGTNPNVSADGTRLVFERERVIWTATIDGSDLRQVPGVQRVPLLDPVDPGAITGRNDDRVLPRRARTERRLLDDSVGRWNAEATHRRRARRWQSRVDTRRKHNRFFLCARGQPHSMADIGPWWRASSADDRCGRGRPAGYQQ